MRRDNLIATVLAIVIIAAIAAMILTGPWLKLP
jgi:hypothetical protein